MSKTYKDRENKNRKKDNFESFFNRKKKIKKGMKGGRQDERMDHIPWEDLSRYR